MSKPKVIGFKKKAGSGSWRLAGLFTASACCNLFTFSLKLRFTGHKYTFSYSNLRLAVVISACLLAVKTMAQEERILVDRVAAIVGDKIILHSDLELQYQQMLMEGSKLPENFRCAILDQALSQKLLLEQAVLDSLTVGEDEIESELDRRIRYFVSMIGSEEKLEEYYGKSIIQIKDEFRKDIEEQLLAQKMRSKILENVKVTPAEVKDFFNAIPKDSLPFFNAEVEIGQLVILPEVSQIIKDYTREKLVGYRERILNGEDFCFFAQAYSEDPGTANDCGNLGFIRRGEMVTEFESAAFKLGVNELSEPVETKFGFHLIQMLERKGDKIKVRHILLRPAFTSADLQTAKMKLDSIRTLIVEGKMKFSEAVANFSQDEETKNRGGMIDNPQTGNNYWEISELDKSIYFLIENLKPGQVSEVQLFQTLDGNNAYRIIYLKSETPAHVANLQDDYAKIKIAAFNQKQDKSFEKWVAEKAKETYVSVDESYRTCSLMNKWVSSGTVEKTYD